MNRIIKMLAQLKESGVVGLSPYITAGDPHPQYTVSLMHALVAGGANLIELGIPFSDPMAEGPVIQAAMERALKHQVRCSDVLNMVKTFRQTDTQTPIVLMGYANPIEQYGYQSFAQDAVHAGVDGLIVVDLPPEESIDLQRIWQAVDLFPVYLCSPTTSAARMAHLAEYAKGYLYYVALKGVTGANSFSIETVKQEYMQRKAQTILPLWVGFGIKTPALAAEVAQFADGVIIGAALVEAIEQSYQAQTDCVKTAREWIQEIRQAIDKTRNYV